MTKTITETIKKMKESIKVLYNSSSKIYLSFVEVFKHSKQLVVVFLILLKQFYYMDWKNVKIYDLRKGFNICVVIKRASNS